MSGMYQTGAYGTAGAYAAPTMSYAAPTQFGYPGAGAAYGAMPHMLSKDDIDERATKLGNAIGTQVKARQTAIEDQYNFQTKALEAECTRVKALAVSQADAQLKQQKQALEMQRDQQKNELDRLQQQEQYAVSQRAAQMQQQRAQMELAQSMQKALYGGK
jgi:di/tripeptidase